ncbi:hypothetical protein [Modicisalibacter xianhensis]|uniref:Uncharacterized protein n=1 Tax=Modicisalibacter xianhensis TaxID=442341 RepID=A0A1I3FQD7_9GAMM|nr:hypothetical protein [Halomonas xianhensis]SFI13384.1 hypothetical protein SAMN04487959_12034 [Halomonas xianhensis]
MMAMRGSTLIGVAILVWVAWIVLATDSEARIERTCQPVLWVGNVATSLTQLTFNEQQESVHEAFNSADYACRFTVWRLLHEDAWIESQQGDESGVLSGEREQ